MREILDQLEARRQAARLGGGEARIATQHSKGKLTARERVDVLLDEGSFEEYDMYVTHRTTDFGMAETKVPGDARRSASVPRPTTAARPTAGRVAPA